MDPRLQAINQLNLQVRKITEDWKNKKDCSSELLIDLQLAIGRVNESICRLTVELGEMRTRDFRK